jgi:hypothetical protein
MDKLYRLVKAGGFCFKVFDVRIGVRVDGPALVGPIESFLPPGWQPQRSRTVARLYSFSVSAMKPRPGVRRFNLLYGNAEPLARTLRKDGLLEAFETNLSAYIAQASRRRLFIHAGVVGWKGRAIDLPGRSYSGKSMLVKEFLKHGATFYSDEFAVFDRRGYVYPFAKPLAIRDEVTKRQNRVSAEELAGTSGFKPLRVGLLLFTSYRLSVRWHPKEMSRGKGALGLWANALSARKQPERALMFLEKAVSGAQVLNGIRGETKEVVQTILAS